MNPRVKLIAMQFGHVFMVLLRLAAVIVAGVALGLVISVCIPWAFFWACDVFWGTGVPDILTWKPYIAWWVLFIYGALFCAAAKHA